MLAFLWYSRVLKANKRDDISSVPNKGRGKLLQRETMRKGGRLGLGDSARKEDLQGKQNDRVSMLAEPDAEKQKERYERSGRRNSEDEPS
jgi:hypothetical protein